MGRLAGSVAVVAGGGCVGAGWGNGKAICVAFAREGARVVVLDRDLLSAQETVSFIQEEGGEAIACRCDMTVARDVEDAVAMAATTYGKVNVLVNNVGVAVLGGPIETSEEDWDRVFAVNVKSAFLLAKYGIPELVKAGGGSIINISSGSSVAFGGVVYCSYASSKAALNQLTRHIGLQYASRGIRANAILPGLIETPMAYAQALKGFSAASDAAEMRRKRATLSPTGKEGTAWDVANAAVYLASSESAYVNAVLLEVDGGLTQMTPGPQHIR